MLGRVNNLLEFWNDYALLCKVRGGESIFCNLGERASFKSMQAYPNIFYVRAYTKMIRWNWFVNKNEYTTTKWVSILPIYIELIRKSFCIKKYQYVSVTQFQEQCWVCAMKSKFQPIPSTTWETSPDTCSWSRCTEKCSIICHNEKEKQKHRLNLIVHNMAESNADQPQARKEQDIVNLQGILTS